jgi:glycosyltransferase involved in cell wall biosynthesis
MRVLKVLPEARSADFERCPQKPGRLTVYLSAYSDLDPSSLHPGVRRARWWSAWLWVFRCRWDVVHLPEPLWLRALPLTLSVGLAVRVADLVRGRRTAIVTYAMENNDPAALLRGVPGGGRGMVFGLVRSVVNRLYDRIALASNAAGDCYSALRLLVGHCEVARFDDLLPARAEPSAAARSRQVAFVGVLESRKGVPDLLAAWAHSGLGRRGWRLAVAGAGPLTPDLAAAAEADPSITPLGLLDRAAVDRLLSDSAVVVLPSRREGRWREQIGLSIVEGLARGCRVVATPDSGLAPWLAAHGHWVLPTDFTVTDLAPALTTAADAGLSPTQILDSLPPIDGRIAAENWMYRPTPTT